MQKRIVGKWIAVSGLLVLGISAQVKADYHLEEFTKGTALGFGYVSVDNRPFLKTSLYPELGFGPVSVALNINAYIPSDGGEIPSQLQSISLRRLSYTTTNYGLTWGQLSGQTMGYGLLMADYDSGAGGSSEFETSKAAFKGYYAAEHWRADLLWTGRNVIGTRLSGDIEGIHLLGRPVQLGASVMGDSDGVSGLTGQRLRPNTMAAGLDMGVPLLGEALTGYAEVAGLFYRSGNSVGTLDHHSMGGSLGVLGRPVSMFNYRLEYRALGAKFVPGYYGPTYEATGFLFDTDAISSPVSGILAQANADLFDGYIRAMMRYEAYSSGDYDPVLSGAVGWREIGNMSGVVNFSQRFDRESRPILGADLLFKPGGALHYIAHIKRVYTNWAQGQYEQSISVEAQVSLQSLTTGIPFVK